MFDLSTVWALMFVALVVSVFWQLRKVAELARQAGSAYCKKHRLQLLSIAMASVRLGFKKGPRVIVSFDLNYSPEGISSRQGEIVIINGRVEQISHWDQM